ncbi:MAG: trypsin-like peptidase domain-containing protein [Singulisphaera sp.]
MIDLPDAPDVPPGPPPSSSASSSKGKSATNLKSFDRSKSSSSSGAPTPKAQRAADARTFDSPDEVLPSLEPAPGSARSAPRAAVSASRPKSSADGKSSSRARILAAGGIGTVLLIVLAIFLIRSTSDDQSEAASQASPAVAAGTREAEPVEAPEPESKPAVQESSAPSAPTLTPVAEVVAAASTVAVNPFELAGEEAGLESPAQANARVKDATVFIKVKVAGGSGSGTGFVIRVDGDKALIATNDHVVSHESEGGEGPEAEAKEKDKGRPNVTVVFRSGSGGNREQSAPATIIATDHDGNRDLAILEVKGIKNLPKPVILSQKVEPVETMPVLIFGFPFGEMDQLLSSSQGNPAITINKGSVSSLRRDAYGQVAFVQIDGSINPGNSGGPVVDDRGRLVGVAVAKINNTTIGFAIPTLELIRMLEGRIGGITLALTALQPGTADLRVQAKLVDPLGRLKKAGLHIVRADAMSSPLKPNPDGTWPPLPDARKVDLRSTSRPPRLSSMPFEEPKGRHILVQASYQNAQGRTVFTNPEPYEIPKEIGAIASLGGAKASGNLSHKKLGALIDPAKDCKLSRDEKGLTITIPGRLHINSPELKSKNAPMALADIDGDFIAQVKIPGDLRPGSVPVRRSPFTFHGAGLLLWEDQNNFMRLERCAGTEGGGGLTLAHRVLIETCKGGKPAGHGYIDVPAMELYLRIERRKGALTCFFGPDGKKWIALKPLAIEFPEKLKVGISASNTSKKEFPARFEEFILSKAGDESDSSGG